MNLKRYSIGVISSFVSLMVLGYLLHGVLLKPMYATAPAGLLRTDPEMMARFHWLVLGNLLFAAAATWIYAYGVESKPWLAQGVRYGVALWILGVLAPNLIMFTIQPWTRNIMIKITLADLVSMVVTGVVIAAVYKNSSGIPRSSRATA